MTGSILLVMRCLPQIQCFFVRELDSLIPSVSVFSVRPREWVSGVPSSRSILKANAAPTALAPGQQQPHFVQVGEGHRAQCIREGALEELRLAQ